MIIKKRRQPKKKLDEWSEEKVFRQRLRLILYIGIILAVLWWRVDY